MIRRFGAKSVALAGAVALVATVGGSGGVFAEGETLADVFTDDAFRGCVISALQTEIDPMIDETSVLEEVAVAELGSLACNGANLTAAKLTGLEYLTGLKSLSLSNNQLTTVDLETNTALERLVLANNELTELDLATNANLVYLDLRGNADLDLDNLDISTTKLNTLTDDDGIWEYVATDEETDGDNGEGETDETPTTCESWEIDDETIAIFKGMLAAYGYDTSKYDATAVRLAALQTNMCDGMSVAEARTLMNAMGVTDLSDAELTEIAAMVTRAYNAINDGATLEELLAITPASGPLVPNTGVSTGEFNASVVVMSLGAVMLAAGVVYAIHYGMKRKEATVTFRR